MSHLSLFMKSQDKQNSNNWTDEERERMINVFSWLIEEDKKQNPELYKIEVLELRRSDKLIL